MVEAPFLGEGQGGTFCSGCGSNIRKQHDSNGYNEDKKDCR
jgi:hypothetical protein